MSNFNDSSNIEFTENEDHELTYEYGSLYERQQLGNIISNPVQNLSLKSRLLFNSEADNGALVQSTTQTRSTDTKIIETCSAKGLNLSETSNLIQDSPEAIEPSIKIEGLMSLVKKTSSDCNQVDEMSDHRYTRSCELAKRKDVVNKGILRAFRKYIVTILKVNRRKTRRRNKSLVGIKTVIIEKAKSVGIIDCSVEELSSPTYVNLI